MFKKLLAGILIGALSILQIPFVSALTNQQQTQVNEIIPTLSTEKLQEIDTRLDVIKNQQRYSEYQDLINYIDGVIKNELISRGIPQFTDEEEELWNLLKGSLLDDDNKNTINNISPEAKAGAEADIMEMQMMMGDSLKSILAELMLSWQELSNTRETGDMSLALDINVEDFEIEGGISLSDYIATTYGFDQELSGEFEAFIRGLVDGERIDINMQTLIDFITLEGNMYLLMENLDFSDRSDETSLESSLRPYVEKMQELARNNTYIEFEGMDPAIVLEYLQSFSNDNISAQIDNMMGEALFEAYSEDDGVVMLRPTQHFCNVGKTILDVFDPFYSDTICSEAQYQELLDDFYNSGIVLTLFGDDVKLLNIDLAMDDVIGSAQITWQESKLISILAEAYDPDNTVQNNASFAYIPNENMNLSFTADEEIDFDMNMNFGTDQTISDMTLNLDVEAFLNLEAGYAGNYLEITGSGDWYGTTYMCEAEGKMSTEFIDLEENCVVKSEFISQEFPGQDTLTIDSTLEVDLRGNKNNFDMDIKAQVGRNEIFGLEVQNTGTRENLDTGSLKAPENTIKQSEAFREIYEAEALRYDSYDYDDYYITDEETGEELYCETYEFNEQDNYDYCTSYTLYVQNFDDYYITDEETGKELYCSEYEYNEADDYEYCLEYLELEY